MSNITVTGNEAYFNEDAKFFKDVYIYGTLYYDFRKRLLEVQDLKVYGDLDVFGKTRLYDDTNLYGYDNFTTTEQFTTFKNEIVVEKEIKRLRVGILTVSQRFNVGDPDGNVLSADVSTGLVGIGYTSPTQKLDVAGSVKIDDFIYDSINIPGGLGYFLTNDAGGIRWSTFPPYFTEGIWVYDQGSLVGTGQSFRGVNLITASGGSLHDLVEVRVNTGLSYVDNAPIINTLNGIITEVYINNSGFGYTSGDIGVATVFFNNNGTGGSGAEGILVIDTITGGISGISIVNPGTNYITPPQVIIDPPLNPSGSVGFATVGIGSTQITGNQPNPHVADIIIKDYWTKNGAGNIFRDSLVGIGIIDPTNALDVKGTIHATNNLLIEGDTFIDKTLNVNKISYLNDELYVVGLTSLYKNLIVSGISSLYDNLTVYASASVIGTMFVNDNTFLNLNLSVVGDTGLSGRLTVDNETFLKNSLRVDGLTSLNNGLIVSGISSLLDDLRVSGNSYLNKKLEVSGITELNNNLFVAGITTIDNSLKVSGITTLGNSLFVAGITTLNNKLNVKEETILENTLDVFGPTIIRSNAGSVDKDTGALVVDGGVGIEENLNVGESAFIRSELAYSPETDTGALVVDGGVGIKKNLDVGEEVIVRSTLTSTNKDTGALVVDGGVGIEENLNVGLAIRGGSTLDIAGSTTLNDTLQVSSNTSLYSTLDVSGATNLNNTLDVFGRTILNNTLEVFGNTTLDSTLDVIGATKLNRTLDVGIGGTVLTTKDNGYIGVGTQQPTREFEIAKDVKFSEAIYDDNDNVGFRTDQYYEVPRSVLSTIGINSEGQIIPGRFFDAANMILLNSDFIAAETVGFLTSTDFVGIFTSGVIQNNIDYSVYPRFVVPNSGISSCRNDIKSILKAITFDITKGGNSKSVGAGLSYYDGFSNLQHITGLDGTGNYSVKDATILVLNKMAEVIRYVINNKFLTKTYQTPPISGVNADAANLIEANKDFIAAEAVARTLGNFPGFTIPTGNARCITDIKLILDAIIYNLTYGGNDRVWDAANFYVANPTLLLGEEVQSAYAYKQIVGISSYIISNQTITKINPLINTYTQVTNNLLVGDSSGVVGSYVLGDCSDVTSAINQFVGIVTSAIGISSYATNSGLGTIVTKTLAGISTIPQVLDLRLQDDVAVGSNANINGCANVVSSIYSCVGIITTIIKNGPSSAPPINYPDGKIVWAPTGAESRHTIWVTKYGNDHNSGKTEGSAKLTIGAAAAVARPGDTIYVRAGIYVEDNPVGLRTDVAVTGQDLRLVNIIPKNIGKDVFHVRRGCTIENLSFAMERIDISLKSGAAVAFPPTTTDINSGKCFPTKTGYLAPGPANEGPSGRWRSPYIRNCTNFMKESIGMKIDGNHATASTIGADLKCMVCDSFTQYNENGIGVSITNNGYAQLVSIFTINCDIAIYCDTGGQCDLTNSNSSFGNYGLVADGLGALEFDARVRESTNKETDTVKMFAVTDRNGNIRKPYDGQALFFKIDINGTRLDSPLLSLGSITVTDGGNGYSSTAPPNVLLVDVANGNSITPLGPEGIIAEMSPTIDDNTGKIVSIDVVNSGRNYLPPPWQKLEVFIEGGGGAKAVANMEPIYYTVFKSTDPVKPDGKDADAYNLITKNKNLIIKKSFEAVQNSGYPYAPGIGTDKCKRDLGLIIDAVTYNLKYGGTDKVYDTANFYLNVSPSVLNDDQDATRVGIETAKFYSIKALKNEYFDPEQFIDTTVIPDTGGYGTPSTCANQASTVGTFFDIIKSAIWINNSTPGTLTTPRTLGNVGICTVQFNEFIPYLLDIEDPIDMFRISRILTSSHSFEYIGTGTDINTSTPQKGGIPVQENQIVPKNGAQIPFTSTNQKGDFEIGEGLIIDQTTRTVRGRDFNRAIQAEVTPLILALR